MAGSEREQAALLDLKREYRTADTQGMGGLQRSTPRYKVPARIQYASGEREGSGRIANISFSGALIEPASPTPSPGTPLGLRASCLAFAGELSSEVVRTTHSGFAVRFTDLEPEALAALRRLLSLAELRVGSSPRTP